MFMMMRQEPMAISQSKSVINTYASVICAAMPMSIIGAIRCSMNHG
jgi:hypothetical protein